MGPRPHVRRRGREPLGDVPPGGVPGARRRPPRRGRVPEQPGVPRVLQGVGRLGARVRRRLGLLGRARVDGARARRHRRPDALDAAAARIARSASAGPCPTTLDARGAGVPRGVGRRLPARGASRTSPRAAARTRSACCPSTGGIHGISDWNLVAELPGLTTFATDPYWKHWNEPAGPFVRRFARLLRETCERHGVRAQLWLPSFGLTKEEIPELEAAIDGAREEGIDDLWTWGYEACGFMTHLATPDSPLVWEAVSAALTGAPRGRDAQHARARERLERRGRDRVRRGCARRATSSRQRSRRSRRGSRPAAGSSTPAPARPAGSRRSTRSKCGPTFGSPPGRGRRDRRRRRRGRRGRRRARRRRRARARDRPEGRSRRGQRERLDAVHARGARGGPRRRCALCRRRLRAPTARSRPSPSTRSPCSSGRRSCRARRG